MLVTASLMSEKDLALLWADGGGELAEKMDSTTECITLTTSGFDTLPPESREYLKKAMESHLKQFGSLYLAALAFGFARKGAMDEASQVIKNSFDVLANGIEKMKSRK